MKFRELPHAPRVARGRPLLAQLDGELEDLLDASTIADRPERLPEKNVRALGIRRMGQQGVAHPRQPDDRDGAWSRDRDGGPAGRRSPRAHAHARETAIRSGYPPRRTPRWSWGLVGGP
jgi:hypothetical protein